MREQMKGLDDLEMGDLWSQVRERTLGPQPEPPTPRRPVASRVTAGIVAFAVFIAAGVFVWQAFRPGSTTILQAPSDGVAGVALWPERTVADLAQTQALADSGDPTAAWRLDPKDVATHFAEDVLGWGSPASASGGNYYTVTLDAGWSPGDSSALVTISRLAIPCPSPPPGEAMTCPPPYDGETISLRELGTTGDAGVWSVTSVTASGLTLDLDAGQMLTNDTQLNGSVAFPNTWQSVEGFHAEAGFHVGTGSGCDQTQANAIQQGDSALMLVSVDTSACDETTPAGYAWIQTGKVEVGGGAALDPLRYSDDVLPHFYGLTMVPFDVALEQAVATPPESVAETSRPAGSSVAPAGTDRLDAYTALLSYLAGGGLGSADTLFVRTQICETAADSVAPRDERCDDVFSADEQQELTTRLSSFGHVTFVTDYGAIPAGEAPTDQAGSVFVWVGPLVAHGDRWWAGGGMTCGGWCGNGGTYVLVHGDQGWRVEGNAPGTGTWVS